MLSYASVATDRETERESETIEDGGLGGEGVRSVASEIRGQYIYMRLK